MVYSKQLGFPIVLSVIAGLLLLLTTLFLGQAEASDKKKRKTFKLPEIKKDCALCHGSHEVKKGTILLKKPVSELCLECHPDRKTPNEHKVDIVPSMQVKQLPLTEGKITCMTCHDPHQNTHGSLLRMPEPELCIACHPK